MMTIKTYNPTIEEVGVVVCCGQHGCAFPEACLINKPKTCTQSPSKIAENVLLFLARRSKATSFNVP